MSFTVSAKLTTRGGGNFPLVLKSCGKSNYFKCTCIYSTFYERFTAIIGKGLQNESNILKKRKNQAKFAKMSVCESPIGVARYLCYFYSRAFPSVREVSLLTTIFGQFRHNRCFCKLKCFRLLPYLGKIVTIDVNNSHEAERQEEVTQLKIVVVLGVSFTFQIIK